MFSLCAVKTYVENIPWKPGLTDIACHWIFFPNITSFSYFLECQTPIFFPFSNSQFLLNRTVELVFTNVEHWLLKQAISLYFGIVWVLFYNILLFSMKICIKSRNLGWKQRKLKKNQRCFGSRNSQTDASHVPMWFAQLCKCFMNI